MERYEMPLGLGMALAQNPEAMQKFAGLTESRKREIINGTHTVSSKEDMRRYVEKIVTSM
ncbi:MAG: YdeI/OmpD-associated family protein [Ruminococcus sp.]|nr:YdeI/OmpD-associated family protein [Ruminococcus sp.]